MEFEIPSGMEAAILSVAEKIGAAKTPAKKVKKSALSTATITMAKKGKPARLVLTSATNISYQARADVLFELAKNGEYLAIIAIAINGTNTYSKLLRGYQLALLSHRNAELVGLGDRKTKEAKAISVFLAEAAK